MSWGRTGALLELLIFVDDLDAMFVLLFAGRLADAGEVAIDCHDGWRCGMSRVGRWAVLFGSTLGRKSGTGSHDGGG